MKRFVFSAVLLLISSPVFAGRETWEILDQVVPEVGQPVDDAMRVRITSIPASVSLSVSGSTVQVRNVNGDNLRVNIISTFSATNPGYVQFPSSQPVNAFQAGTWTVSVPSTTVSGSTVSVVNVGGNNLSVVFPSSQPVNSFQAGSWTTTSTPSTFSVVQIGTEAVTNSGATLIFSGTGNKGHYFCNESTNTVRVGGASVTVDVGIVLKDSVCITLDGPEIFVGDFYCVGSVASSQKVSWILGK